MKKKQQNLLQFARELSELKDGRLEGGFELIGFDSLSSIVAGTEATNNCNGGNCVARCGQVNRVEGCGVTKTQ